MKAGELTGRITYNGVTSDAFVTVMETALGVEEIYFGTASVPDLFIISTFEGSVKEITLTCQDHEDGILESVERIAVPEIQFTPALPWNEGEGGKITLKTSATYQDLIDGILIIVIEAGGEEKDGIITYDENDGKYYLGYGENLKCYEVINTDQCHVSFTPISDDTKILSIEREFPEILSTSPEFPWGSSIQGRLVLSEGVEQQFLLDKVRVKTVNVSTGVTTNRKFVLYNGRLEVRTTTNWVCYMSSFVGRLSQFSISTNSSTSTSLRVTGFEIIP